MAVAEITRTIDARDLPGAGPLMHLVGAVHEAEVGDLIEMELHPLDRQSLADIAAWLHKSGHELVEVAPDADRIDVAVRKAH